jgi:excisionase family DNA binding protein
MIRSLMSQTQTDRLYSPKELGNLLDMGKKTLTDCIASGKIKATRQGANWLVPFTEVQRLRNERLPNTTKTEPSVVKVATAVGILEAHKTKRITSPFHVFDGKVWRKHLRVRIDCGIVDLVQAIWRRGIPTVFSCENVVIQSPTGKGLQRSNTIQISVPNLRFAETLVYAACSAELDDIGFWKLSMSSWGVVHCFFPCDQLPAIMKRLTDVEPLAQAA